jgi:DNA-binding IclR family transcriptional regulator
MDAEMPGAAVKRRLAALAPEAARPDPADDGPMARVLSVIDAISFAEEPLTLKDVEERTALPKPTVHRMLAYLERRGYIQRAVGLKTYFAGPRLAAMAVAAVRNRWSHHESHKILSDLVARVGETCNVTVLDGPEVVIVDRVETHWPMRYVMQINARYPLHCTSSGKLYLALMAAKRRAAYLRTHELFAKTPNTITDVRKLEKALDKIRSDRYSFDNEEFASGLLAMAAPIEDPQRRMIGTVAINASNARVTPDELLSYLPLLQQAAKALGEAQQA